jgi:hypothetical protein
MQLCLMQAQAVHACTFTRGSQGSVLREATRWSSMNLTLVNAMVMIHMSYHQIHSIILIFIKDSGIDKIKSKSELIEKFGICVKQAEDRIPIGRRHRTHIALAATAGMRLLRYTFVIADSQFKLAKSKFFLLVKV